MKRNLLLALSMWLAGSSAGSAQYHPTTAAPPYYPQSPAPAVGGFPGYKSAPGQRYQGFEPYPTHVIPASATAGQGLPTPFPLPSSGSKGLDALGKDRSEPETIDLPVPVLPPNYGSKESFLPPAPAAVVPFPKALPKTSAEDSGPDSHDSKTLPPAATLPAGPACDTDLIGACLPPSPGQPVVDQLIPRHPSGKGESWFFTVDYLRWWAKDQSETPPFTFTTATGGMGALRTDPDNDERTGVRAHLGRWVDSHRKLALEGDFTILGDRTQRDRLSAVNLPGTMLPFFEGIAELSRTIEYRTSFWQQEFGLRYKAIARDCWHIDLTAGNRYISLDEDINIATSTTFATQAVVFSNATVTANDRIQADNRYIGGQIGLEGEYQTGVFFLQAFAKFGVGNNRQRLNLSGDTTLNAPPGGVFDPPVQVFPGRGAFVAPSNAGFTARNRLAFVPEAGIFAGIRPHNCVRLALGYNFLFISDVVRPADQIDTSAGTGSPLAFFGPPFMGTSPIRRFESESFWLQGVSVRLEIRY